MLDSFDDGTACGWRLGKWGGVRNVELNCRAQPAFRGPLCLGVDNIQLAPDLNEEKGRVELIKILVPKPGVEDAKDLHVVYKPGMKLEFAYFVDGPARPSWISICLWAKTTTGEIAVLATHHRGRRMKPTGILIAGKWQTVEFPLAECKGRERSSGEVIHLPEGAQVTRFIIRFCWNWRGDYSIDDPPQVKALRLDEVRITADPAIGGIRE